MLSLLDAEEKVKRIYELRNKKEQIAHEIAKEVNEIVGFLQSRKKNMLKLGDYSVQYQEKIKRVFDFEIVEKCIAENKPIPKESWKLEKYYRLFIDKKQDIKLVNGQFVKK